MLVSNKPSTEFDDRKVQWHRLSNLKENNVVFENCQADVMYQQIYYT
jgi:hypothetical protein